MEPENKTLINISINNEGTISFTMDEAIETLEIQDFYFIAVNLDKMKNYLYELIDCAEQPNCDECDECDKNCGNTDNEDGQTEPDIN